jgi:hypothetical protein
MVLILNSSDVLANPTMEFYVKVDDEFPSIEKVQQLVFIFETPLQFKRFLLSMVLYTGTKHLGIIVAVETFKANMHIIGHSYEESVDILIKKFDNFPQLSSYVEDFKSKCSLKYRREKARKKLNCFYFRCVQGLCPDVLEQIINLV